MLAASGVRHAVVASHSHGVRRRGETRGSERRPTHQKSRNPSQNMKTRVCAAPAADSEKDPAGALQLLPAGRAHRGHGGGHGE